MGKRIKIGWLFAVVVVCLAPSERASADSITPVQFSAIVDVGEGNVTFSALFDQPPDFSTTDSVGRQADSFQFYLDSLSRSRFGSFSAASVGQADATGKSIVRGENIHFGSGIPLIWIDPTDSGPPENGGWGPTVKNIPFNLVGNELTFSLLLADVQDADGYFWYGFQTYTHGKTVFSNGPELPFVSDVVYTPSNSISPVPEPSTHVLALTALACSIHEHVHGQSRSAQIGSDTSVAEVSRRNRAGEAVESHV